MLLGYQTAPVHSNNPNTNNLTGANNNNNNPSNNNSNSPSLITDAVTGLTFVQACVAPVAGAADGVTHPRVL